METRLVENGQVAVPRDYFLRMAKMDYNDYKEALAREFYQNSVDAGASTIDVNFYSAERKIVVKDNGCGMDYSTIKDKLLVLGGSEKRSDSVGAFGKAKEVLYFSWEKYEVRTRDLVVRGRGADYTIERTNDHHHGTTSTIWMWEDEDLTYFEWAFRSVAKKFQVDTSIRINDMDIVCDMKRGDFVKNLGWASIYVEPSSGNNWRCNVRIQGQWMFSHYHGEDDLGKIVLELHRSSTDALTSNRDALNSKYKEEFSKFIRELITNRNSAIERENPTIRKKYKGTGKVAVALEKLKEGLKECINTLKGGVIEDNEVVLSEDEKEEIIDYFLDSIPASNMSLEDLQRIEQEVEASRFVDIERLAFVGYEPEFVTIYDTKDKTSSERFMKTKKAKVLARAWTSIIKQVLLDIGWYGLFTAGFNFQSKLAAGFEKIDDEVYFYLNPTTLLTETEAKFREIRYDAKAVRHMLREDLLQKAIHEITHLYTPYHNEGFTSKCEWVRARTWKSIDIYPTLVNEAFQK
jgi:hypothetical protein